MSGTGTRSGCGARRVAQGAGTRASPAKGRVALHQFSQTRQLPGRTSVDRLPGLESSGVEFEAVAVGEHPKRGVIGVRDDEVGEVGARRGYGAVYKLALF